MRTAVTAKARGLWRRADGGLHRISQGIAVDRWSIHNARLVPNGKEYRIIVRNAHPSQASRRLFEKGKNRLDNHPKSKEQKRKNHGKAWNEPRPKVVGYRI